MNDLFEDDVRSAVFALGRIISLIGSNTGTTAGYWTEFRLYPADVKQEAYNRCIRIGAEVARANGMVNELWEENDS